MGVCELVILLVRVGVTVVVAAKHSILPPLEKVLGGQGKQAESPEAFPNVLTGHVTQVELEVAPATLENFPVGHLVAYVHLLYVQ